jgi:hypothetical protein
VAREDLLLNIAVKNQQALGSVNNSLSKLSNSGLKLSTALKGAAAGLVAFGAVRVGSFIVNTTKEFEDLRTTLSSVTGSTKDGADAFKFISEFATQTQFGVEDLTKTFIKLKAAGIEPTEKLLTTFTDTAAITNDQIGSLEAMTDLFARTVSGGLGLEEINRLSDRGVPVLQILEEKLGITRMEISAFGKTAEGAKKITDALAEGIQEKYAGATQRVVSNLSTEFSNASIAIKNVADDFGQGLSPALKEAVGGFTKIINENRETIGALGELTGKALKGLITVLGLVLDAIGGVIKLFKSFIAIVTDTVKAVTDFKNKVVGQFDDMKTGITGKMKGIKDTVVGFFSDTDKEVVSGSIVPDMVDGVIKEFNRMNRSVDSTLGKMAIGDRIEESLKTNVIVQSLDEVIGSATLLERQISVVAGGFSAFRSTASSALTDVIFQSKSLKDALGEIAKQTLRTLIQGFIDLGITIFILKPLKEFFENQVRTQEKLNRGLRTEIGLRTVLAFLTGGASIGIPGFASGGMTGANQPILVGERGPEIFVPGSSGTVIPNNELGGSGGSGGFGGDNIEVTFNINTIDATDFDQLLTTRQDMIVGLINKGLAERGKRSLFA